jgi:hypothetical protein
MSLSKRAAAEFFGTFCLGLVTKYRMQNLIPLCNQTASNIH